MRGVIYTRARTASLLQEQLIACRKYAEAQTITVGLVLSDLDEGTTLERPGLKALRSQAPEQLFDVVIAYDHFALSRRLDLARQLLHELHAMGVKVHFLYP